MADVYQVTLTAPSRDEADRLGRQAVERRLAACAQVSGPITSTYWWEDQVTTAPEWVCVLKTTAAHLEPLMAHLQAAHSYETPEIIATAVEGGSPAYLAWVAETTGPLRPRGPRALG